MKDYYALLEIAPNSTESDIRKAFRKLAKKYHPDINKSANAHEKFIEISEAYEFLLDQYEQKNEKHSGNFASGKPERFRQEAREKAKQQAKMQYEEFKKEHEAFQKSGFNDLSLLFTLMARIAFIPAFFFLFLLPVYLATQYNWTAIFILIITWPFAGLIFWYAYDNRKSYFRPGKFYYSFKKIKQIYTELSPTQQKCFYCPTKTADSKPYKLNLLKLKDLKIYSEGFRQHNVNYINKNISILVPRSRKAFIVHSLITLIKIMSIVSCLIFLNISSLVWRIIIGLALGELISLLLLLSTGTKSNVSYLFSYGALFRVCVWIYIIARISHFSVVPFNIITSDYIYFVMFVILLFDCVLLQLINYLFRKHSSKPIIKQYADVNQKYDEGYCIYNDITVISVVYPLFRWIFG